MSREQLVDEYVEGRLRRKAFVRKLAALGVSVASALTYADRLALSWVDKAHAAEQPGQVDTPGAEDPNQAPNFYPA